MADDAFNVDNPHRAVEPIVIPVGGGQQGGRIVPVPVEGMELRGSGVIAPPVDAAQHQQPQRPGPNAPAQHHAVAQINPHGITGRIGRPCFISSQ